MKLVGANRAARVTALDELPGKSNYFIGNDPKKWRTDVPTYAKVKYAGVYPGIDLVYYGNQGRLEYDFVVAAGADPKVIQLAAVGAGLAPPDGMQGARAQQAAPLRIDANGDLVVETDSGEVRFRKPVVYQPAESSQSSVVTRQLQETTDNGLQTTDAVDSPFTIHNSQLLDGRYVLSADNRIHFEISSYDQSKPLVIDPVLSYSTYLGGSGGDVGQGIAVDASGAAYITGSTASLNFPTSAPLQASNGGASDVFVTKLNPAGSALVYSTYLGGNGADSGTAIAVDASGNAHVTGSTTSTNFPATTGVFQAQYGGNGDAFVAELNPAGSALVYSSYLGGSGADLGQGIALDSAGNAYVTGATQSTDFPTLSPLQGGNDGAADAFVAKVNPSGSALVYSTYLGGSAADTGQGIAVDGSGNAYVTGYTSSLNFPVAKAAQPSSGGGVDAFVTELNAAGSALVYSTYLGGSNTDRAHGIALDSSGNVYVTGDTASANFPATVGAFQAASSGNSDAFVTKLSSDGSALVYSTFLGGGDLDRGSGIAVDSSGNAYVTGLTQSSNFPTARPSQASLGGGTCGASPCSDAFVTELDAQGALLGYSTYLGGGAADTGQAIALDSSGNAYVTGSTASSNFPVIAGAFQGAYAGAGSSGNAFVAKIAPGDAPGLAVTPQSVSFGNQAIQTTRAAQTVTVTNAGSASLQITSVAASADFAQTNTCAAAVAAGGGTCTISVTFTPTTVAAETGQLTLTDDAAGSPHQIALAGTGVAQAPAVTLSPTSLTFPNETVGATSPAQTVTLSNSGSAALNVTMIALTGDSGDFAQTNTCGTPPVQLAPAASCIFTVTFKPTATGSRTGSLTITDSASGSPHAVSLTGNGAPVFSLSAASTSSTVLIGTASTTFTVTTSAPSSFTSAITLSCESGATCAFNPTSIKPGQSSALTVSGLSATSSNPTNLTVDGSAGTSGTTGSQTAKLALSIFFQDFSVGASPTLDSVSAGQSATYTISVSPVNGFNESVTLSCPTSLPAGVSCSFNPSSVTPKAPAAATSTLTVKTTVRSAAPPLSKPGPTFPGHRQPAGPWLVLFWAAALLAAWGAWAARRPLVQPEKGGYSRPARGLARTFPGLALFVAAILLTALWTGCGSTTSTGTSGTPASTYQITITGTLGSNNAVIRGATVVLAVS